MTSIEQFEPQHVKTSFRNALWQKRCVMHAVILRDLRSRFFNHGLGFLIVPLFPVVHIAALLAIYAAVGRSVPFGDDLRLFFATGLTPVLTFMYVSRFMSVSLLANKSMMAFPVVRLLDIVLARAALEFVAILLSVLIMFVVLISTGTAPYPADPASALAAMAVVAVMAVGMGIVASVISAIWPIFAMVYALSMLPVYLASGGPIYLHSFPEEIIQLCSWNPLFHAVIWMRKSYYLGYPEQNLSEIYLIAWAVGSLAVGLVLERVLRRSVLQD